VGALLQKALVQSDWNEKEWSSIDDLWKALPLVPSDYSSAALRDPITNMLMKKIKCEEGGKEFDEKFPDGTPTIVRMKLRGKFSINCGFN